MNKKETINFTETPILDVLDDYISKNPVRMHVPFHGGITNNNLLVNSSWQFRNVDSDPMQMGRNAGAYDALRIYPGTIVEVMRDMKSGAK